MLLDHSNGGQRRLLWVLVVSFGFVELCASSQPPKKSSEGGVNTF